MIKIKTPYNTAPDPGIAVSGVSMTVPDQALSIREILQRYTRGMPLGGGRPPVFDEDEEYLPDPRTLDLTEIASIRDEAVQTINKAKAAKAEADKKHEYEKWERKFMETNRDKFSSPTPNNPGDGVKPVPPTP